MIPPQNKARFEFLRGLSTVAAVQAWLEGDFGIGDEPALLFSIRKDARVVASDDDIFDAMCGAIEDGLDAAACLAALARLR